MGSSQPSDPNLPFGYSFDPEDFNFEPPPEPAPGNPLLSDNENRMLSTFFDDLNTDHYNLPSFGEGLNYSDAWLQLPPQFMGTASSLGQSSVPSMLGGSLASPGTDMGHGDFGDMMAIGSHMMPPPPSRPAPPIPQANTPIEQHHLVPQHQHHASEDVLAAASLLQNGSASRPNMGASRTGFAPRAFQPSSSLPVGHMRHQPLEDFKRAERMNSFAEPFLGGEHQTKMFTDMVFGPSEQRPEQLPSPPMQRTSQPPVEVQWGSDPRFNRVTSFVPDSARESYDALEAVQLSYMACIEPSRSAATTRPSSPLVEHSTATARNDLEVESVDDANVPPRKRRKSPAIKEDVDDDDDSTESSSFATKGSKKRKGKADGAGPSSENGMAGKRRKSGTTTKPTRENLSEAQKRENHIRSEQKRRTLIKEGFDDLCDLVPGLKGGGFSKSTMLTMAAEWLVDTLKGNDELKTQLEKLDRQ